MAKNKKKASNEPLNYEDKKNWTTTNIEQNPDFANNPKGAVNPFTKKVVNPLDYRNGDLDDYDFGDDVRMNSRNGYDWTDANGNQHSTYDVYGNRYGSYHSITDKDGNKKVYYQNGGAANSYIRALNGSAKKAWEKKLENAKNGGGKTPTTTTTASTITGENLKLGGDDTKISGSGKLGQPMSSSNDKDTLETTGVSNGSTVPTKEELEKGSRTEDIVGSYGEGANFQSPYVNAQDNLVDREKLEEMLTGSEGREKGIYGILPAFLLGDYGNYHLPKYENKKHYQVIDPETGKPIEKTVSNKSELKELNKQLAKDRKAKGWKVVGTPGRYSVYDPETKKIIDTFDSEEEANAFRKSQGKNNRLLIGETQVPGYAITDGEGNLVKEFNSEKEAKDYLNKGYELGDTTNEEHYISYNGKKMKYDSKEEAEAAKKELSKMTRGERSKAYAQLLYQLVNSMGTSSLNAASDFAGEGRPHQSSWQNEINRRVENNSKLYYDNETAKNSNVRRLVQLADEGVLKLTDLTNQEVALFISAMGKEKAMQLLTSVGKQQIEKYLAMDWAKNWTPTMKNAYVSWAGSRGAGPANETFIALASGQTSIKDIANKWNTETKYSLAKSAKTLDQLDEAIKANKLTNKMTQAQVDVVKELVTEQLRAARLSNDVMVKDMITSSVDSVAKLVDAAVPF